MKDYDVAVIGGGLLGSAFAWGLADRGLSTVLFDEGDNAIRTARGNFGLVWVQGKGQGMPEYARWSLNASRDWIAFAERLKQETDVDPRYHRCGGYSISLNDEDFQSSTETLKSIRGGIGDENYEYEVVDYPALKKRMPLIGNVSGATFSPNDGHCDPLKLLRALHTGFLNQGGQYKPCSPISVIKGLAGGGFELSSAGSNLITSCEKVVVAAGHGSRELGSQVGLDVPVFPVQGQVLVTEKAEPILHYPTNIVRQTDEGSFLLGPSSRDVGYDLATESTTLRDISRRCVKAFPLLKKLRIQRVWAALRVMTPDGFPVYQQSDSYPGAFSFSCHSGVTLASSHATRAAQWVVEGSIPQQFEVFHPRRFYV